MVEAVMRVGELAGRGSWCEVAGVRRGETDRGSCREGHSEEQASFERGFERVGERQGGESRRRQEEERPLPPSRSHHTATMSLNEQAIRSASVAHPRPHNTTFAYGTAGFRAVCVPLLLVVSLNPPAFSPTRTMHSPDSLPPTAPTLSTRPCSASASSPHSAPRNSQARPSASWSPLRTIRSRSVPTLLQLT